jgi:hypothetical protein
MSLEKFREPTTPESRMHRAVLLAGFIGVAGCAWRLFVGAPYSVEVAVAAAAAAVAYAVWRYFRQPSDSARRFSN